MGRTCICVGMTTATRIYQVCLQSKYAEERKRLRERYLRACKERQKVSRISSRSQRYGSLHFIVMNVHSRKCQVAREKCSFKKKICFVEKRREIVHFRLFILYVVVKNQKKKKKQIIYYNALCVLSESWKCFIQIHARSTLTRQKFHNLPFGGHHKFSGINTSIFLADVS